MPSSSVSSAYLAQAADLAGNPGQQAAYDSQGHCVVLAGPGSGKTKTLVLKLARILAEDVRAPRGAACITYSQECARGPTSTMHEAARVSSRPFLSAKARPVATMPAAASLSSTARQRSMRSGWNRSSELSSAT